MLNPLRSVTSGKCLYMLNIFDGENESKKGLYRQRDEGRGSGVGNTGLDREGPDSSC